MQLPGPIDVKVHDSLLIVTTQDDMGMWSFFALPELRPPGKWLTRGRGPSEFLSMPWVSEASFFADGDNLMAFVRNCDANKACNINVTQTLRTGALAMTDADALPKSLSTVIRVDANTIFCHEWGDGTGVRNRFILGDSTRREALELLNSAKTDIKTEDYDIYLDNVIGAHIAAQPGTRRMAEAGLMLNRLNIYDLDGDFRKTVCVGNSTLESIAEVCRFDHNGQKLIYGTLRAYPQFFVALYKNTTMEELGTAAMPVMFFFDWQGKPLAQITADRRFDSFDIDLPTGWLYTLHIDTEEIFRYDISEILDEI